MKTRSFPIVGTPEDFFDALKEACEKYKVDGTEVCIFAADPVEEAIFPYEYSICAMIDMQKIKWYYYGSIGKCEFSFTRDQVIANYTYPGAIDKWDLTKGIGKMIYEKACDLLDNNDK